MAKTELETTSFDPDELKRSLISFLESTNEFGDFNYEGSAINATIDLLTRNTTYTAYLANMLANESFIASAQMRGNVSSHAQKLSYLPKSKTASRITANIKVTPSGPIDSLSIRAKPGLAFLASVAGQAYTFTLRDSVPVVYKKDEDAFIAREVELYQGQMISERYTYNGDPITIRNKNVDISTLRIFIDDVTELQYDQASSLKQMGPESALYFVTENANGRYQLEFGHDILGMDPPEGSIVRIEYVNTEKDHANGVSKLIAGGTIDGYSNISVDVVQPSYGGSDQESIEKIRFMAPRHYRAQDRALGTYDYQSIILADFPFITSAISWGGEDNEPPMFGNVFVSILPEKGVTVTRSLRERIESAIKRKGVGSVTPIVKSPVIIDLDVDIHYQYNQSISNVSESELETSLIEVTEQYNKDTLRTFGSYYNQSELVSRLKEYRPVESVVLKKRASTNVVINNLMDSYYDIDFQNRLERGTVQVDQFVIDANVSDETVADDSEGNVVYSYRANDGTTKRNTIGVVDYDTGEIQIQTKFSQERQTVRFSAEVPNDNFYVKRNTVVQIGSVEAFRSEKRDG